MSCIEFASVRLTGPAGFRPLKPIGASYQLGAEPGAAPGEPAAIIAMTCHQHGRAHQTLAQLAQFEGRFVLFCLSGVSKNKGLVGGRRWNRRVVPTIAIFF